MTDEEIKAQPYYWVAVSIPHGSTGRLEDKPRLAMMKRDDKERTLYWNGGPSKWYFTPDCVIHKYYPDPGRRDDDLQIQFYRDFPISPANPLVLARGGWLAPDGKMYQCHGWEHGMYARWLCAIYYGTLEDEKRLEQEGWLRITGDGTATSPTYEWVSLRTKPITQAQIDCLFDLTQVTDFSFVREKEWRDSTDRNMRLVEIRE